MSKRRTHSSIDLLPDDLLAAIRRMLVDDLWPDDYTGDASGTPTYDSVVEYLRNRGHNISRSAVGRYGGRMKTLARMKQAGLITRDVMADLTDEKASATQKAAAEMITALAIELMADMDKPKPKDLTMVAAAMRDCTAIAINADKYIRTQIKAKAEAAARNTKAKLTDAGVDRKLIQEIIDEQLGIVKS